MWKVSRVSYQYDMSLIAMCGEICEREGETVTCEFLYKSDWHLGSLTAANWVSFDFNVSYSSCWGYSLINTLKLQNWIVYRSHTYAICQTCLIRLDYSQSSVWKNGPPSTKITSHNLWPQINLNWSKPREARFQETVLFFAASAAKFWKFRKKIVLWYK